jgi:GNAT superfamily N-acetyltransferase
VSTAPADTGRAADISIRRASPADDEAVLALLRLTLGKRPDDPYERFFHWKHRENPFGTSPAWLAECDGQVVGYRTFLRWGFEEPDGDALRAVRAVDTATHPSYQGRGIFQRLTLQALDEIADDGVDLVFNTPNDQSRPGYLKMGWTVVEQLPVAMRPRGPVSVVRLARTARSRPAADLWSAQDSPGTPALDALAAHGVGDLVASLPRPDALATPRTMAYLWWRYGLADLGYRAFPAGRDPAEGMVLGRVRSRGAASELAVCEVLAPDRRAARAAVRGALRRTRADYAIGLGGSRVSGMVPIPKQGPLLTWRQVSPVGRPPDGLSLGDVELF